MKSRGVPGGKRFPLGVPPGDLSKSSQLTILSIGWPQGRYAWWVPLGYPRWYPGEYPRGYPGGIPGTPGADGGVPQGVPRGSRARCPWGTACSLPRWLDSRSLLPAAPSLSFVVVGGSRRGISAAQATSVIPVRSFPRLLVASGARPGTPEI